MKLTAAELTYVRSQGLYITERCDACGKLLNRSFRYTITGKQSETLRREVDGFLARVKVG